MSRCKPWIGPTLRAASGLLVIAALSANDGSCGGGGGSGPGETPQCAKATDCTGLPHVLCAGAWECTAAGQCDWNCSEEPAGCVVSGCSGEVCGEKAVDTDCVWKDWYSCLKLTTCGRFGADNTCAFQQTAEFVACLQGGTGCKADTDCPKGLACVNGTCEAQAQCDASRPCPPDAVCKNGQCVPVDPVCKAASDCPEGQYCIDGRCQYAQNDCKQDSDCPAGWRCELACLPCVGCECLGRCVPGGTGCGTDQACPAGQACVNGVCQVICTPSEEVCDGIDNNCDGQVDEGCAGGCTFDTECRAGEWCDHSPYDEMVGCCVPLDPSGAGCPPDYPVCPGTCRLQEGRCWTDADCPPPTSCVGAQTCDCPDGAMCKCAPPMAGSCQAGPLPCASDADCLPDQACVNGLCVAIPGCQALKPGTHGDCKMIVGWLFNGTGCVAEGGCTCEPDCAFMYPTLEECEAACGSPVGCNTNADCRLGETCVAGTCVLAEGLCYADSDCPAGTVCQGSFQCPPGTYCLVAAGPGKCVPSTSGCQSDGECPVGQYCNLAYDAATGQLNGTCTANPAGSCVRDADCGSGKCVIQACPACFPCPCFGTCEAAPACTGNQDCPAGQYCAWLASSAGVAAGTCQPVPAGSCVKDADCAAGQTCVLGPCPLCVGCPCYGTCQAPTKCTAVKPNTHGLCDMVVGVIFTGTTCTWESGCGCAPDCGSFFKSLEDCKAACF